MNRRTFLKALLPAATAIAGGVPFAALVARKPEWSPEDLIELLSGQGSCMRLLDGEGRVLAQTEIVNAFDADTEMEAEQSGIARVLRITGPDGWHHDLAIGKLDSGADVEMNTVHIQVAAAVQITSMTLTMPDE